MIGHGLEKESIMLLAEITFSLTNAESAIGLAGMDTLTIGGYIVAAAAAAFVINLVLRVMSNT